MENALEVTILRGVPPQAPLQLDAASGGGGRGGGSLPTYGTDIYALPSGIGWLAFVCPSQLGMRVAAFNRVMHETRPCLRFGPDRSLSNAPPPIRIGGEPTQMGLLDGSSADPESVGALPNGPPTDPGSVGAVPNAPPTDPGSVGALPNVSPTDPDRCGTLLDGLRRVFPKCLNKS